MTTSAARPDSVREVERKYSATPDQALPSLSGLPGIAGEPVQELLQLSAQYYDTDDFRLVRAGITLRKRTGGDDAGWHLKLPSGQDTRTELRFPLTTGDDSPPPELGRLVRGVTRGRPLSLIALINTTRHRQRLCDEAGALQAEVVADSVTAILAAGSQERSWNEIEVEQADGGRKLADAIESRLFGAGIQRSDSPSKLRHALEGAVAFPDADVTLSRKTRDPGEFLRQYLQQEIHHLALSDVAVRRDESEAIHDMRKASRRARSALQTYAAGLGLSERALPLIADLRWLGQRLSKARDIEVQWERIVGRLAASPAMPQQEAVYARVNEYFSEQTEAARDSAITTLDSDRYLALLTSLDQFVEGLAAGSPRERRAAGVSATETTDLSRTLQDLAAKVAKRVRKVHGASSRSERDELMHRARKGAKRMRYAMEVIRPLAPKKAARALDRFDNFQDVLGEFQDSVVAREHLLNMISAHDHAADSSFGLGIMYQQEIQIGDDQAGLLEQEWKKASKAARKLWT